MICLILGVFLSVNVLRKMPQTEEQKEKGTYQSMGIEGAVFIHPDSVLAKKQPQFVVYQEVIETSRPFMRGQFGVNDLKCLFIFMNIETNKKEQTRIHFTSEITNMEQTIMFYFTDGTNNM